MDTAIGIQVNNHLRRERIRRNWRQLDLAEQLGTTVITVKRWERGSQQPSTYFRVKLCALFGKSAEALGFVSDALPEKVAVWCIPFSRNPFFTGRIVCLQTLHEQLEAQHSVALSQPYALSGLGGIGKTQLALEYTYQHASDYQAIFWIAAETVDTIDASFTVIAEQLHLSEYKEKDHHKITNAVLQWLATHKDWLLIFDNVESLALINSFISRAWQGRILITTRLHSLDGQAHILELPPLTRDEGVQFLLRRIRLTTLYSSFPAAESSTELLQVAKTLVEMMDGLPLALDQVGAYIERTGCSLIDYLHMYQSHHIRLLDERSELTDHPQSVVKTILLSFQQLERVNEAAADLLRLCAFMAPDAIPEELFTRGTVPLGPLLDVVTTDVYQFNHILGEALQYSLLYRQSQHHTLSQHRLVQVVLKATMDDDTSDLWAARAAALVVACVSPFREKHAEEHDDRYLPHARAVLQYIQQGDKGEEQATFAPLWYYIGLVAEQYSQLTEAKHAYLQGLEVARRSHSPLEDVFLVHAGCMMSDLGDDPHKALHYLMQGTELAKQLHDEETLCFALLYQGQIEDNLSNYQSAEDLYKEGLAIALSTHDWTMASKFLQNLGVQSIRRGDYEQTTTLYREGLIYAQRSQHLFRQSAILMNFGMLAIHQHQYEQSLAYSLESLTLARQVHHRYRISAVSQNIGIAYRLLGQLDQSQHYLEESLRLAHEIEHLWLIAETQGEYGLLLLEQKRLSEAQTMCEQMLANAQTLQAPELIAHALFRLAQISAQQHSWERARTFAQESLERFTQLGDAQRDCVAQWLAELSP